MLRVSARTAGLLAFAACAVAIGPLAGALPASAAVPNAHTQTQTQTFSYTDFEQYWTVPADVYSVYIQATGGSGQAGQSANGASGGAGGYAATVSETIAVTPGKTLGIDVASDGDDGGTGTHSLYAGAGGQGDNPAPATNNGGFGGGATGVWVGSYPNYVVIAGGGGGGGGSGFVSGYSGGNGGDGGGYAGGGGLGSGAGSGGSGDIATYANGQHGGNSGLFTYGGGGGGGGAGFNGTVGGGYGGGAGQAGGGGGGGGAGGASEASSSSATFAIIPAYGDGSVTLTWSTGEVASQSLAVTPNPGVAGQNVTFTDTITPSVSGSPAPGGTVTFQEYNVNTGVNTNWATVPVTNGVATWTTSSLPAGTHYITPIYSGDGVYFEAVTGYTTVTIDSAVETVRLSPGALAFGNQTVNTLAARTVTLTDTGNVPWHLVGASTDNSAVSLAGGNCWTMVVQPGGSCTVTITFKPATVGAQSGTIFLVSNFPTTADISVTGTGVAPPPKPAVSKISPRSGRAAGGTKVTITGKNLTHVTAITFGSHRATKVSCTSSTTCTAISPAGSGTVDVRVTTTAGTSPKTPADRFTY